MGKATFTIAEYIQGLGTASWPVSAKGSRYGEFLPDRSVRSDIILLPNIPAGPRTRRKVPRPADRLRPQRTVIGKVDVEIATKGR